MPEDLNLPQFNSNSTVIYQLFPDPEGNKRAVTLKQPTDEQIARRQRGMRIVQKDIGRGAIDRRAKPDEAIDRKIMDELRVDGAEVVEPEEIDEILGTVMDVDIKSAEREGRAFRITLEVFGGASSAVGEACQVTHLVNVPALRDLLDYRKYTTRIIQHAFGFQEVRVDYTTAAAIYDKCVVEKSGYAEGSLIPAKHKASAISGLIQGLEFEKQREAINPENFRRQGTTT